MRARRIYSTFIFILYIFRFICGIIILFNIIIFALFIKKQKK